MNSLWPLSGMCAFMHSSTYSFTQKTLTVTCHDSQHKSSTKSLFWNEHFPQTNWVQVPQSQFFSACIRPLSLLLGERWCVIWHIVRCCLAPGAHVVLTKLQCQLHDEISPRDCLTGAQGEQNVRVDSSQVKQVVEYGNGPSLGSCFHRELSGHLIHTNLE